jgi:hypothetical protein
MLRRAHWLAALIRGGSWAEEADPYERARKLGNTKTSQAPPRQPRSLARIEVQGWIP